jgi:hypothetical protein
VRNWRWVLRAILVLFIIAIVAIVLVWFVRPDSVSVASALFAAVSAFGALFTALEMRLDRIERTRPFVVVDFQLTHSQLIYFTVRNLGSGIARNVSLEFDPVPVDLNGRRLTDFPIFQKPVRILAPGGEIRQLFHIATQLLAGDTPTAFKVTAKYQGEGSWRYSDVFDIDLQQYKGMTVPPETTEEHLAQLVDKVDKLVKSLDRAIKFDSIIIETPEQHTGRLRALGERIDRDTQLGETRRQGCLGVWRRILSSPDSRRGQR